MLKLRPLKLSLAEAQAIADDLGVSLKDVKDMEGRLSSRDSAFDAPVGQDDETVYSPSFYLEASDANPADAYQEAREGSSHSAQLAEALERLDDRSRDIVQARWLTESKLTLHHLAARYSVSAERIRQIEIDAMKKLKGFIAI